MKNKIKGIISKNFGWKALSLLLSMVLWFIVMNVNNPTEIKSFTVNLSLLNKDKLTANGLMVLNETELEQTKIEIKIRGTREALNEINKKQNRDKFTASVDLQQFQLLYAKNIEEPVNVGLTVSPPSSLNYLTYELMNYSPSTVSVDLDNITSVIKDVNINIVGNAQKGYVSSSPSFSPDKVQINGPESEIKKVSLVKVNMNISNSVEDVHREITPIIVDAEGNELSSLKTNVDFISITVPINKKGQIAISEPVSTGTPEKGYVLKDLDYYPKSIDVLGDENGISKLTDIELPPINVEGASSDKTIVFDIRPYLKDTGLSLRDANSNEVTIIAKIVKEDVLSFNVPTSNISISGYKEGYNIDLKGSSVSVKLTALKEILQQVNESDLKGSINLNGLDEGKHSVEVEFNLPDGVKMYNECIINLEIKKPVEISTTEPPAISATEAQEPEDPALETEIQEISED